MLNQWLRTRCKMKYILGIIATVIAMTLAAPVQAVTTPTTGQILQKCPDVKAARACPPSAEWFLSSRPPSALADEQIVDLVLKLVDATQSRRVPMRVCLN